MKCPSSFVRERTAPCPESGSGHVDNLYWLDQDLLLHRTCEAFGRKLRRPIESACLTWGVITTITAADSLAHFQKEALAETKFLPSRVRGSPRLGARPHKEAAPLSIDVWQREKSTTLKEASFGDQGACCVQGAACTCILLQPTRHLLWTMFQSWRSRCGAHCCRGSRSIRTLELLSASPEPVKAAPETLKHLQVSLVHLVGAWCACCRVMLGFGVSVHPGSGSPGTSHWQKCYQTAVSIVLAAQGNGGRGWEEGKETRSWSACSKIAFRPGRAEL